MLVNLFNRFNRNGLKNILLPEYNRDLAEFLGICLGDGCVTKYQVGVTLNFIVDKAYSYYVLNLAKKLFPDVTISYVKSKRQNTIDIKVNSWEAASFMKSIGIVSKYLSNHRDITRFREIIGFSNPKLIKRSLVTRYEEYRMLG